MFDYCPTSYQIDYLYDAINYDYVVAVFCRQSGKSFTTGHLAVIYARRPNSSVLIFAPTDRQTGLIAEKITNILRKMITLSYFQVLRQTQREFHFSNGSKIICETTGDTGENIRGYTGDYIILEEAGSIKDSIIHSVILPMGATTNAKIIKIGTPRGMNHFYESYKDSRYKVHQIPWPIAVKEGILKQDYVDEVKRTIPVDKFRTEMMAEFIADEDAYFSYELVDSCKAIIPEVNTPVASKEYFLGADIARLGQDSTCLMILEKGTPNNIVKIIDIPKCTLDFIIDKIKDLHKTYHFQKIYIDETGLGAGVRDVLAREHNPFKKTTNITSVNRAFTMTDIIIGMKFTLQSKIDIFSNLKVLMEQGLLKYPPNTKLISQLRDFRYETTESGNVKLHHSEYGYDDYCDALALVCQGTKVGGFIMDW